jgi:hypothetical protein
MFNLRCDVSNGVFSNERLVTFTTADGEQYRALVDASLVETANGNSLLRVFRARVEAARALIALPNDGTRVWVACNDLAPVT